MEKSVSTIVRTQRDLPLSPEQRALQVKQITEGFSERMPDRLQDLFRHPSSQLRAFDSSIMIEYLVKQASASVSKYFSVEGPGVDTYTAWAEMVMEDYSDLRLVELRKIFRDAAKEVNYNRIDASVMYGWVRSYYRKREEAVSIARENYHRRMKQEHDQPWSANAIPAPEFFKARTAELMKRHGLSNVGRRVNKDDLKVHELSKDDPRYMMIEQQREMLRASITSKEEE